MVAQDHEVKVLSAAPTISLLSSKACHYTFGSVGAFKMSPSYVARGNSRLLQRLNYFIAK